MRVVRNKKMKLSLLTIALLFIGLLSNGQQLPECELYKASITYCRQDYQQALRELIEFRQSFPKHPMIEEVNQQIGHLYFLTKDFTSAKQTLNKVIVGKPNYERDPDYTPEKCASWDTTHFCHRNIVYPEPYVHLQHLASLDLAAIYKVENKSDSALIYLGLADTVFFYNYGCVNGNDMKAIELSLLYKDLYLKQNNIKAAVKELTRVIFTYEQGYQEVSQSLKELLPKIYTQEQLHNEIEQAINNLEKKSDEAHGKQFSWFQLKLFGVLLRIPMYKAYSVKEGKMHRCETAEQMKEGIRDTHIIKELLQ